MDNSAITAKVAAMTEDERSSRLQEIIDTPGDMSAEGTLEFTKLLLGANITLSEPTIAPIVEEPTDEQIREGWTRDPRGYWQPPGPQRDFEDIE